MSKISHLIQNLNGKMQQSRQWSLLMIYAANFTVTSVDNNKNYKHLKKNRIHFDFYQLFLLVCLLRAALD